MLVLGPGGLGPNSGSRQQLQHLPPPEWDGRFRNEEKYKDALPAPDDDNAALLLEEELRHIFAARERLAEGRISRSTSSSSSSSSSIVFSPPEPY